MDISAVPMRSNAATRPWSASSMNKGMSSRYLEPWTDRQDEALRHAFVDKLRMLSEQEDTEIWCGDESGFEGDPRPRMRWDKKGHKTRSTKNGDHLRMNALGMVCPRSGKFFAIEATHVSFRYVPGLS